MDRQGIPECSADDLQKVFPQFAVCAYIHASEDTMHMEAETLLIWLYCTFPEYEPDEMGILFERASALHGSLSDILEAKVEAAEEYPYDIKAIPSWLYIYAASATAWSYRKNKKYLYGKCELTPVIDKLMADTGWELYTLPMRHIVGKC